MMRNVALGLVLMMSLVGHCYGYEVSVLRNGYYQYERQCIKRTGLFGWRRQYIDVEKTVTDIIRARFDANKTIAPALIRMQFHDCFVKGCDASILINGKESEKTALPNRSVREYKLIDDIKQVFEQQCPQVVSCADIIAMATRDVVYFASSEYGRSRSPWSYPPKSFAVQTGRKDGLESLASNVVDLPGPRASVPEALAIFAKKGLNEIDFTYLLGGGHSVGVTHCVVIQDRLSNFSNTGKPDPNMNKALLQDLIKYCKNQPNNPINLDQGFPPDTVDTSLYREVTYKRTGIFRADQELAFDDKTRPIVNAILKESQREFIEKFWQAMVRLQAVDVIGSQGEVRRTCTAVNGVF